MREEPVVLSSVLADAVNANFSVRSRALVDTINGVRIEKIDDVIRAFERNDQPFDALSLCRTKASSVSTGPAGQSQ